MPVKRPGPAGGEAPEPARERAPAPPKPAASIVLMRDRAANSRGAAGPPEVLLVERHRESVVGPGALVFPGGVLEPQDGSPAAAALSPALSAGAAARRMDALEAPAQALAYRVAAIRETFEEALVLLARPREGHDAPASQRAAATSQIDWLQHERERLHAGEVLFVDWLAAQDYRLLTERLVYFAHWITPEAIAQRFSARFFLAGVPAEVPVVPDRREISRHVWLTPAEAIAMRGQGAIHLMDPTVRNLELLGTFRSTAEALRELARREVRAILPKVRFHPDGSRTVIYPWERAYQRA